MKHMRRTLAALLAMVILMTGIPFSFAEETEAVETVVQQIAEPEQAPEEPAPEEEPAPTEESAPTEEPTDAPTEEPTDAPAEEPTDAPAEEPTDAPTEEPTDVPEETASAEPLPSEEPTPEPSAEPTDYPVFVPEEALDDDSSCFDGDTLDVPFIPVYTVEALAEYMDMSVSELADKLGMDVDALLALSPEEIAAWHERLATPASSNTYAGKISLGKAFSGYVGTSSTLDYEIYISRSGRYLLTTTASKYMVFDVYRGSEFIRGIGHFASGNPGWTVDLEAGHTYTFKVHVDGRYVTGYCNFSALFQLYIAGSYADRASPLAYDVFAPFTVKYDNDFQLFCFTAVEGKSYRITSTGSLRRTVSVCDANLNSIKSSSRGIQGTTTLDVTLTPGRTYYLNIHGEYYSSGVWWYQRGNGEIKIQCLDKTTKPISFTKSKSSVNPGFNDSVTFNVSTPYATKVRILTDGKYIGAEHAVSGGKASFSESFHVSGARSVQVQGYYNGSWSLLSDAQTITVNYQPNLGKPVFSSISGSKGTAYRNRDYTLRWNSLANAVRYSVYVYSSDELLYKTETDANQVTIPGWVFGTLGVYYVDVYGMAKLGQQSNPPARAEITVEDSIKGFAVNAYLLEHGIVASPTEYYDDFSIDHAPGLNVTLKSSSWIHLGWDESEDNLTYVGVTIDANPKSSDREGYIDISASGCATVRIKVLQCGTCPHKYTGIIYYDRRGDEMQDYNGPCTAIDKYSHGYNVYVSKMEYICWECDAILRTVTQDKNITIKEEHSYENGACWACGFSEKNGCQHTSFVTKYDKYEFIDEQQHRHTSFDTSSNPDWEYVVCAECGIGGYYEDGKIVLDLNGSYYADELRSYKCVLENHSYVNGKCACGATRAGGTLRIEGKSSLTKGVTSELKVYDVYGALLSNRSLSWTSSAPSIATVDYKGRVQAKAIGSATITAEAADGTYGSIVINVVPTPQSVTIYYNGRRLVDREVVTMDLNSLANLRAEVYPADADPTISWTTTNKSCVSVSTPTLSSTTITAHKETNDGVYITAQTSNGKKAKVKVRVVDPYKPTGVFLDREGTVTLNMGSRLTLYATLQPAGATRSLTWTSSSTKIATVDQNGVVTPIKEGTVTITVKTHNGKYDTVKVKVVDPYKPTGVYLDREGTVVLRMGSSLTLKATLQPAGATRNLTWTSSSTKVATVDQNGVVTGIKEGTVTITVKTHNGKKDTVKVKVAAYYPVQALSLSLGGKSYGEMYVGDRAKLSVTYTPSKSCDFANLTWRSNNTKVVTVDGSGNLSAVGAGYAMITATDQNTSVSASFGVVVTRKARYRAIVIVENSFINHQGYKLPYQRASDRSGLISMLKQQNFNGQRVEQIADLSNLSKSTLVSKLRSLPSQWGIQEGDVTYFCFLGHGSKDGCLFLYSNGAENQYIRPSELKSLLDNIPGKVIVSIGSCYSGNYVYGNSADDDSSDSEGSPSDFTSAIIHTFADGDSMPIAAVDESGAEIAISNEERMSWEESGIMPNSGELRQSKYYVLTSAARNEESWSLYSLTSSRYPYSINESKTYACFERAFCYAGGRDSVTKKTTWSSGTKTLSSVYSTVKKQVASYQKGTIYSQSVQVYPSNSSFVIFSK